MAAQTHISVKPWSGWASPIKNEVYIDKELEESISNCFNIDNFCGKILYKYMGFKEGAPAFMTIEMMLDLFFLCSFVKVFFRSGVCFVL